MHYRAYFYPVEKEQKEDAPKVMITLVNINAEIENLSLSKSIEEKDMILATVTHDMRTPLTAIKHTLQKIIELKDINFTEGLLNLLKGSVTSCELLHFLINDIIDAAKLIKTGKVTLNVEQIDIGKVFTDIFTMMQSRFKEKGLDFFTHIDGTVPDIIVTDSRRLKQIILNFLSNSLKFTTKGRVSLLAKMKKNSKSVIEIIVKDTGMGIKEAEQQRIFEKFFTSGGSLNKNGVGLGLGICKKLASLLGPNDQIYFRSKYKKGSKFWIRIFTDVEASTL